MEDIREKIFSLYGNAVVTAGIYAEADGVVAGISRACAQAAAIGLNVDYSVTDGNEIFCHDLIMRFSGTPVQICEAEDTLISEISKYSGVATAAKAFVNAAANTEIVCGSWKKMPKEIKGKLRDAITLGGASVRICKDPMVYLDKNYVAILGGIQKALMAVKDISGRKKAIQVKGRYENGDIVREALTAVYSGADIIYVDTGNIRDLQSISVAVRTALSELGSELGTERHVKIAFGGGVTLAQVPDICAAGADIIGVGRAIIDAPLLDLKLEVTNVDNPEYAHSQYDLFHKHELTITGIHLKDTNLTDLSNIVADVIGIDRADVLVIDVRYDYVSLDILRSRIDPEKFISKEEVLLNALSMLHGVELDDNAGVVSNGMLGWIAGDNESLDSSRLEITRSKELAEEIRQCRVLRLLRAEILHLLEAAADRLHPLPLLAAEQQAVFPKKLRLPALHRDPVDPLIHGLNGLIEDHRLPQHKVCHLAFPPHAVRLSPSVVPGPGPAFCWIDLFPILARAFRGCQSAVAPGSAPRRRPAGRAPIGRSPHSPPCANAAGLL